MRKVAFVLFPKFSMIGLTSALEPLRVVNRYGAPEFSWTFVSADGEPVDASNGIPVSADHSVSSMPKPDIALFCASYEAEQGISRPVLACARRLARQGVQLGGVDSGQIMLAEAGVLDGYRVAVHWETVAGFRETYRQVDVTNSAYEIDRDRLTAATGSAAIDMMLDFIGRELGQQQALFAAEQLGHRPVPGEVTEARLPPEIRYQVDHPRVVRVLRAMEENAEDLLSTADLARIGGISVRQMERLFAQHLNQPPRQLYREIRLIRAERLLTYSKLPVTDVAVACGFTSVAEFSRAYKRQHGSPPSRHRRRIISAGLY
ncbi:MAG: GlxA family transcriptional regulator [Pseudomonadota bacterium]